ncbi:MAG: glycoside hydrolase family 9 protein [Halanaerobiales bacterium]
MISKKSLVVAGFLITAMLLGSIMVMAQDVPDDMRVVETYPEGQLLKRTNFEDEAGLPWQTVENPPAQADFSFEDDAYVIEVIDPEGADGERWDLQFRHRELWVESGHTYEVEFTVEASESCSIYPKIGDQADPFEEDWNYQQSYSELQLSAGEKVTVEDTFTADRSAEQIEFAFHLADAPAGTEFKFHEVSIHDSEFEGHPPKLEPKYRDIRVNQLGYFPNREKKATLHTDETSPVEWWLEDQDGYRVAEGETEVFGDDEDSGEYVHIIDFTEVEEVGEDYQLKADTSGYHDDDSMMDSSDNVVSYPFDIADDMYSQMPYDSMKYFYYNRSGIEIEMPYAESEEYERPAGHDPDVMEISTDEEGDWAYDEDFTVDVTGGWYDAGDHGKYVVNGGISVWTLMNLYERTLYNEEETPEFTKDDVLNIPESGNEVPDILDETRWNVETLLKMQVPEDYERAGMAFHKGHDESWTGLAIYPHEAEEEKDRILKPPTTAATLNLAAFAAQASRLWEEYDEDFAQECLETAERAWEAANENPDIYAPFDDDRGGGPYGDDHVEDEFYWAAAELFITTGESEYEDYIKDSEYYLEAPNYLEGGEEDQTVGEFNWGNVHSLGTISLALVPNDLSDSEIEEARQNIAEAADFSIDIQEDQGYGTLIEQSPISITGLDIEGYPWGSNSFVLNSAIVQAYAFDFTNDGKYLNAMSEALDYILGRNPLEYAYVTGYGDNAVENPHHRVYSNQVDSSFPKAPDGIAVGGPNSGLQDPWVASSGWGPGEFAPQKCYMDHIESWSTNECTINWNAPLAWVSSYLNLNGNNAGEEPPPSGEVGDVNSDGNIDSTDVTILQNHLLGDTVANFSEENADVNEDSNIDSLDLSQLTTMILSN